MVQLFSYHNHIPWHRMINPSHKLNIQPKLVSKESKIQHNLNKWILSKSYLTYPLF